MPLDPNIILQGPQPVQIEGKLNAFTRALQAKNLMTQNDAAQAQIDKQKATSDQKAALTDYLGKTPGFDWNNDEQRNMAFSLAPDVAPDLMGKYTAHAKDMAGIEKDNADTASKRYELSQKKVSKALYDIATMRSKEEALAHVQLGIDSGDLPKEQAAQIVASITSIPDGDANAFGAWRSNTLTRLSDAASQLKQQWESDEKQKDRDSREKIAGAALAAANGRDDGSKLISGVDASGNPTYQWVKQGEQPTVTPTKPVNQALQLKIDSTVSKLSGAKEMIRQLTDIIKNTDRATLLNPMSKENALASSLATQLGDIYKSDDFAALGVISGPDLGRINAVIPDPTKLFVAAKGPDSSLEKLAEFSTMIDRTEQNVYSKYGKPGQGAAPVQVQPPAPAATKPDGSAIPQAPQGSSSAYQEYWEAWHARAGHPELQAQVTAKARAAGVIK